MTYIVGARSESNLEGVLPGLALTFRRALVLSSEQGGPDFGCICGVRSDAAQEAAFASGASKTKDSAHKKQPDGHGHAIDLLPVRVLGWMSAYPQKTDVPAVVRQKLDRFNQVARFMFLAADELDFPLQWGNDWDVDGIPTGRDPNEKGWLQDMPHFQFPPVHRIQTARLRRVDRMTARSMGVELIS